LTPLGNEGRGACIVDHDDQPYVAYGGGDHVLLAAGIKVSTDGRGRWMDNVFIERLWRSLKYEYIDVKGYADGPEAKVRIASWVHSATAGGRTRRWEIRRRWQSGARAISDWAR
jgi:transposase InsO family protein